MKPPFLKPSRVTDPFAAHLQVKTTATRTNGTKTEKSFEAQGLRSTDST